jgi:hypothetical protein
MWILHIDSDGDDSYYLFNTEKEAETYAVKDFVQVLKDDSEDEIAKEILELYNSGEYSQCICNYQNDYSDDIWYTIEEITLHTTGEAIGLKLSLNIITENPINPILLPWVIEGIEKIEDSLTQQGVTVKETSISVSWVDNEGNEVKDAKDIVEELTKGQESWQTK